MGPIVVDASLTLNWCFADEATHYSRSVLATLESTYAVVPALWPFEVASVLTLAERHQRITRTGIVAFMDTLRRLPIQVDHREALWLWQPALPLPPHHPLTAYHPPYFYLPRL